MTLNLIYHMSNIYLPELKICDDVSGFRILRFRPCVYNSPMISMCSKEGISKTWLYLTITLHNRVVLGDQVEHNKNK